MPFLARIKKEMLFQDRDENRFGFRALYEAITFGLDTCLLSLTHWGSLTTQCVLMVIWLGRGVLHPWWFVSTVVVQFSSLILSKLMKRKVTGAIDVAVMQVIGLLGWIFDPLLGAVILGISSFILSFFKLIMGVSVSSYLVTGAKPFKKVYKWVRENIFRNQFNWVMFVTVSGAVYLYLRRKYSNKQRYENLVADIRNEGLSSKTILRLLSSGMKVGVGLTGLMDLGAALTVRDLYPANVVTDLFRLIADILPEKTDADHPGLGSQPFVREGSDDDDDSLDFLMTLLRIKDSVVGFFYKYRFRMAVVTMAVCCGVALYIFMHLREFSFYYEKKKDKYRHIYDEEDVKMMVQRLNDNDRRDWLKSAYGRGTITVDMRDKFYDFESVTDKSSVVTFTDGNPYKNIDYHTMVHVTKDGVLDCITQQFNEPTVQVVEPQRIANKIKNKIAKTLLSKEALVTNSAIVDASNVANFQGDCLDDKGDVISHCIGTNQGILMNLHSFDETKSFKFNGKVFPKTKMLTYDLGHPDMIMCEGFDGAPRASKKIFAVPDVGQKVTLHKNQQVSSGVVAEVTVNEFAYTCSTRPGWCGAAVCNTNGRFVGIHFSSGEKDKNNRGIRVTPKFLTCFDTKPKN